MTKDELRTLILKLEPDRLLTRAALSFWLKGNDITNASDCIAYCVAQGWLHSVTVGEEKFFRDAPPVVHTPLVLSAPKAEPAPRPQKRPERPPQPIVSQPRLL